MSNTVDIASLIKANPRADEQEIAEAMRLFRQLGSNEEYGLAIPYSQSVSIVDSSNDNDVRRVVKRP